MRAGAIAGAVLATLALTGGALAVSDRAGAGLPTGTGMQLNAPIVGAAAAPDGSGYWLVGADGGVFTFGQVAFYGSTGAFHLNRPIVALTPTPDGGGYWLVAADGGVFAFGDAGFFGSASGLSPNGAVVGLAASPDGRGYWEAAANGAVFAFGDAPYGGGASSAQPVVGISALGTGYRMVAADGGIFDFGGAPFLGSTGGLHLNRPMIGISSSQGGYITVSSDGGIFAYGNSGFYGSLAGSSVYSRPSLALDVGADGVTDFQRQAWFRVNMCEEGGLWNVEGSVYSGGLGFSHANWATFNTFGYPADAAKASAEQQIRVAVAFAVRYWGNPNAAPDQHGCTGGY